MNYPSSISSFRSPLQLLLRGFGYLVIYSLFHFTFVHYFFTKKDYAWGETGNFQQKLRYLRMNASRYNTVFLGSSIVKNNINPCIFDSVASGPEPIRSFNLGTNGMYVPTTFFIAEKIIADTSLRLKYLFLDYDGINDIARLLHTEKSNYWITAGYLRFTLAAIWHQPASWRARLKLSYQYLVCWVEKHLGTGRKTGLFSQQNITGNIDSFEAVHNGFMSLEYQLAQEKINNETKSLSERRSGLLKDTSRLGEALLQGHRTARRVDTLNSRFQQKLQALIHLAASRGIQLVYLFQPRNADKPIYNEFRGLPVSNKIDQSLNAAWYTTAFHFDNKHLNDSGAAAFSTVIAKEFLVIKRKKTNW